MLHLNKLKLGDRVKVVDRWGLGCIQNAAGHMDKWLGKVVTIKDIYKNHRGTFASIVEDPDWAWNDFMFDCMECDIRDIDPATDEEFATLLQQWRNDAYFR